MRTWLVERVHAGGQQVAWGTHQRHVACRAAVVNAVKGLIMRVWLVKRVHAGSQQQAWCKHQRHVACKAVVGAVTAVCVEACVRVEVGRMPKMM